MCLQRLPQTLRRLSHAYIYLDLCDRDWETDRHFSNKFSSSLWDHTTEYLRKFEFCSPDYAQGYDFDKNFKIEELSFLKYKKGGFYKIHSDEDFLWKCVNEWYRLISYVYFVNDDYSGGKLVFPQHDQKIHPKKNRLVIFPSNWCFEHKVEPVIKGTRSDRDWETLICRQNNHR